MWEWCDSAWTQYLSGIKSLFFISEMLTDLRTDRHEEDNSAPKGNKIIRLVPLHIYDESQDCTYNKQMQLTILFLHFQLEWIKWISLVHLMVFDDKSSTIQWLTHLPPHSSDSHTHHHIFVTHTLTTKFQRLLRLLPHTSDSCTHHHISVTHTLTITSQWLEHSPPHFSDSYTYFQIPVTHTLTTIFY